MSIFLDNKYTQIYDNIITRARNRVRDKNNVYERHHVIPESFYKNRSRKGPIGWLDGDSEDLSNKVYLTPKEHYICHLLLVKMTTGRARQKCAFALSIFIESFSSSKHNRYKPSSRMYDLARKIISEEKSKKMMGNSFGKNRSAESIKKQIESRKKSKISAWNKGIPISEETRKKISIGSSGERNGMYGKNHSEGTKKHLSEVKSGKSNIKLRGKEKSKEHRENLSKSLVGKSPNIDNTTHKFIHDSGLEEHCTKSELVRKYDLNAGAIHGLVHGIKNRKHHKGWRIKK